MKFSIYHYSCNKQAELWKTTIDLLCLNQEEGHAEAGKIIRCICSKSIVVFHCSACLLQDLQSVYPRGVTSRLVAIIYVAMVMPILYDNSYTILHSPNDSNLEVIGLILTKIVKLWHLKMFSPQDT